MIYNFGVSSAGLDSGLTYPPNPISVFLFMKGAPRRRDAPLALPPPLELERTQSGATHVQNDARVVLYFSFELEQTVK